MTEAHANGHGAFDLEAAAAAEVAAVPFAFQYKGRKYELPPMAGWPLKALRAVAAGDLEDALGLLIGPATYDRLCDAGLTIGELGALFRGAGAGAGMPSLPNSGRPAQRGSTRTSKR